MRFKIKRQSTRNRIRRIDRKAETDREICLLPLFSSSAALSGGGKLAVVKFGVKTALFQKRFMVALFQNMAVPHD